MTGQSPTEQTVAFFVCPDCKSPLEHHLEQVCCTNCSKFFLNDQGLLHFGETGVDLDVELEPVIAGPSTSLAYQEQYQELAEAADYNQAYREKRFKRWSTQREFELLERLLSSQEKCDALLDIPCGGGRLSPAIAVHTEHLIECDIAVGQVRYARKHSTIDTPQAFITANAFNLPLPDESVDAVVCIRLNHHLPTHQERCALIQELLRVSKRFVVMTYFDYHSLKNTLRRLRRPFDKKPPKMTMKTREVRTMAIENGARLIAQPMLMPLSSGHRYALIVKNGDRHE